MNVNNIIILTAYVRHWFTPLVSFPHRRVPVSFDKTYKKYEQLVGLGFTNVYIYVGGMFEWLLLQDIYGQDLFPTTSKELDILKYKSQRIFDVKYIQNG